MAISAVSDFNPSDNGVQVSVAGTPSDDAFTLTGWFRIASGGDSADATMLLGLEETANSFSAINFHQTAGTPRIEIENNSVGLNTSTYVPAIAGAWFFVGLVGSGTNLTGYIKKIGDVALTSIAGVASFDFTPNRIDIIAAPFVGANTVEATDIKVFNSALSNAQVLAESKNYAPQVSAWAWYKLAASGTATADSSGNTRTGTLRGSVSTVAEPVGVWDDVGSTGLAWIRA